MSGFSARMSKPTSARIPSSARRPELEFWDTKILRKDVSELHEARGLGPLGGGSSAFPHREKLSPRMHANALLAINNFHVNRWCAARRRGTAPAHRTMSKQRRAALDDCFAALDVEQQGSVPTNDVEILFQALGLRSAADPPLVGNGAHGRVEPKQFVRLCVEAEAGSTRSIGLFESPRAAQDSFPLASLGPACARRNACITCRLSSALNYVCACGAIATVSIQRIHNLLDAKFARLHASSGGSKDGASKASSPGTSPGGSPRVATASKTRPSPPLLKLPDGLTAASGPPGPGRPRRATRPTSAAPVDTARVDVAPPTAVMRAELHEKGMSPPGEAELLAWSRLFNEHLTYSRSVSSTAGRTFSERKGKAAEWVQLFNEVDEDRSGTITFDELKRVVRKKLRLPRGSLSELELRSLWCALDSDDSCALKLDEFVPFLRGNFTGAVRRH